MPVTARAMAAYLERRKLTLAGAPITLPKLKEWLKLRSNGADEVNDSDLQAIAQYLRVPIDKLRADVAATPLPTEIPVFSPSAVLAGKPVKPAQTLEIPISELAPLIAASRTVKR